MSFADGRHTAYAESFARSNVAASYVNSMHGSGSNSAGYYYSGGGHGSSSNSSGSASSGSVSSAPYSSGSSSSGVLPRILLGEAETVPPFPAHGVRPVSAAQAALAVRVALAVTRADPLLACVFEKQNG